MMWYVTFYNQKIICDYTGNYQTQAVQSGISEIKYKTTFMYSNGFNKSYYHYTPEIIDQFNFPKIIISHRNYFGNIIDYDEILIAILMLVIPIPIYPIATILGFCAINILWNYDDNNSNPLQPNRLKEQ